MREDINIDVDKGDTILVGKWKNKKEKVKHIGTDEHGMPTINSRKAATFRIQKNKKDMKKESLKQQLKKEIIKILKEGRKSFRQAKFEEDLGKSMNKLCPGCGLPKSECACDENMSEGGKGSGRKTKAFMKVRRRQQRTGVIPKKLKENENTIFEPGMQVKEKNKNKTGIIKKISDLGITVDWEDGRFSTAQSEDLVPAFKKLKEQLKPICPKCKNKLQFDQLNVLRCYNKKCTEYGLILKNLKNN